MNSQVNLFFKTKFQWIPSFVGLSPGLADKKPNITGYVMFLPLTAKFIITIDQWQLKMDQFNCKLDFYKDLLTIKYLKIKKCIWGQFSKCSHFQFWQKWKGFFYFIFSNGIDVFVFGPVHLNLWCLSRVPVTTLTSQIHRYFHTGGWDPVPTIVAVLGIRNRCLRKFQTYWCFPQSDKLLLYLAAVSSQPRSSPLSFT